MASSERPATDAAPAASTDLAASPPLSGPAPAGVDTTTALVGKPVTLSAVRRAEAQRIAAERAAAERAAAATIAPPRPALDPRVHPPVLIKRRPPVVVRFSQAFWILSIAVGVMALAYLLIIRSVHREDVAEFVRSIDPTRADATYLSVADVIIWSVFGAMTAILLIQVTGQVAYANRRPGVRWWMLGTLLAQIALFPLMSELVALGSRGQPLRVIVAVQIGCVLLGFLFALMPAALSWTASQHDVGRAGNGEFAGGR